MLPRRLILPITLGAVLFAASIALSLQQTAAAGPYVSISAGAMHTCAVTAHGTVDCWGRNHFGQLGDGTTVDRAYAVTVEGLEGVTMVSAGGLQSCALLAGGTVSCWGTGLLPDYVTETTPFAINLGGPATKVTSGMHASCALMAAGNVMCWGRNDYGERGMIDVPHGAPPNDVELLGDDIVDVDAGEHFACAIRDDGTASCWGRGGPALGGLPEDCHRALPCPPVDVTGVDNASEVHAGAGHACALTEASTVICWGDDSAGQLGDGPQTSGPHATEVVGLGSDVAVLDADYSLHSCVIMMNGETKCWGNNFFGQLGNGAQVPGTDQPAPVDVTALNSTPIDIAAGGLHTCALLQNGGVRCWGDDHFGQLGDSNGDGVVDSVDAVLILQLDAALIDELPNPDGGDVNADALTNSQDASIILQYVAGLVVGLE